MAGEPSPALSSSGRTGPPQAALRRVPSASPTNRPRRATSAGTSKEGEEVVHHRESSSGPEAHEPARDRGSSSGPEAHEPAIDKRDPFRKRAPTRHTTSLHTTSLATRLLSAFSFSARVSPQPTPTSRSRFSSADPTSRSRFSSAEPGLVLLFHLLSSGAPPFAPPPFRLRLPSCFCEKPLEGGRALSLPPPRAVRGTRKVSFGSVQEIIPPKSDPSLT